MIAIKASGVSYAAMSTEDVVLVSLQNGEVVYGERRPSPDPPPHRALSREFKWVGGVVHTHSPGAPAWAKETRETPLRGTPHAALPAEPIPLARALTPAEVADGYEAATGK